MQGIMPRDEVRGMSIDIYPIPRIMPCVEAGRYELYFLSGTQNNAVWCDERYGRYWPSGAENNTE